MAKLRTVIITKKSELEVSVEEVKDFLKKHILVYMFRYGGGQKIPNACTIMKSEDMEKIGKNPTLHKSDIPCYDFLICNVNEKGMVEKGTITPIRISQYLGLERVKNWFNEIFKPAFDGICEDISTSDALIIDLDEDEMFRNELMKCPDFPPKDTANIYIQDT